MLSAIPGARPSSRCINQRADSFPPISGLGLPQRTSPSTGRPLRHRLSRLPRKVGAAEPPPSRFCRLAALRRRVQRPTRIRHANPHQRPVLTSGRVMSPTEKRVAATPPPPFLPFILPGGLSRRQRLPAACRPDVLPGLQQPFGISPRFAPSVALSPSLSLILIRYLSLSIYLSISLSYLALLRPEPARAH